MENLDTLDLECPACFDTFDFYFERRVHLKDEHGIDQGYSGREKLCPVCGDPFPSNVLRKEHIAIDHGEDTYMEVFNRMKESK